MLLILNPKGICGYVFLFNIQIAVGQNLEPIDF